MNNEPNEGVRGYNVYRHEKSGLWFLKHIFQAFEGSSKLPGFFAKIVCTINFTNLPTKSL